MLSWLAAGRATPVPKGASAVKPLFRQVLVRNLVRGRGSMSSRSGRSVSQFRDELERAYSRGNIGRCVGWYWMRAWFLVLVGVAGGAHAADEVSFINEGVVPAP